jgi:type IV secretion system protein VirB4
MRTSAQLNRAARGEIPAADHIPFGSMVAPSVVRLRGNRGYLAAWRLDGIAFETADADYIRERKEALHHFIRSLGGGKFALWTHKVRRAVRERLDGSYDNAYARRFNERYYDSFDLCDTRTSEPLHRQMVTELYVSAIYRPTPSLSLQKSARAESTRRGSKRGTAAKRGARRNRCSATRPPPILKSRRPSLAPRAMTRRRCSA